MHGFRNGATAPFRRWRGERAGERSWSDGHVFSGFMVLGDRFETHAQKICKIMDMAVQNGAPVID